MVSLPVFEHCLWPPIAS